MKDMPVEISDEEFDDAVVAALDEIPSALSQRIENLMIFVEDRYTPAPGENPDVSLLGLYEGIPLPERGMEPWAMPDRITLFKEPIQAICSSREEVIMQIRTTVIHEVAHFFGISDAALEQWGWG